MTDLSLFKVMEGTNNVILESAHNSVLAILYNTHSNRLIKAVLKQVLKQTKHQFIRIKCAEYVLILF